MHTTENDLRNQIQNRTGTAAVAPAFFYAFQNIDENVRHQLQKAPHPSLDSSHHYPSADSFTMSPDGRLREIKHS